MHDYIVSVLGFGIGIAGWLVKRMLAHHLDRVEALESENIDLKLRILHLEDVLIERGKSRR